MPDELKLIAEESVQSRATADAIEGPSLLYWMANISDIVAPWWSRLRDANLRDFWMASDHVSGAIYNMTAKMASVDFHVEPEDVTVKSYMRRADELTRNLYEDTELGAGWRTGITKWVADLLTQDNGAFFEVVGPGPVDRPLDGAPLGLIHMDARLCSRTRSPEFPVIYTDLSGARYKMHYTRVIYVSQLPSADARMNNIGFCAVSRMLNVAQHLIDITKYEQEKLGSRPKRQLLIANGITGEELMKAFYMADKNMDAQGLTRYAQTVAIGSKKVSEKIEVSMTDLASAPDGFDKEQSTTLGMFTIALALGVDARELWPASSSGATKADAMLQHMKARGKGPGQIRTDITDQINQKYLPYGYKIVFDVQDDEEDAEAANIKKTRADTRKVRMESTEINVRVARQQALSDGDLTEAQFDELELADGRLPGGEDVITLFYSLDPEIDTLLELGTSDPLTVEMNDAETMNRNIDNNLKIATARLVNAPNLAVRKKAQQAIAALRKIKALYGPTEPAPAAETKELDDESTQEIEDYQVRLAALADMTITEEMTPVDFRSEVISISEAVAIALYLRSLGETEMTTAQQAVIDAQLALMRESAGKFAIDIQNGKYNGPDGRRKLLNRLELWANAMAGIVETGRVYGRDDLRLKWVYNPIKEHCNDCIDLNGLVKTAKEWRNFGVVPRSHGLECGGWRCGCSFEETKEPVSGRGFPEIRGPKKELWEGL